MKLKIIATVALIAGLSSMANAKTQGNVYSPEQGVICDKKSGFCSDSYGISLGMTKDFLGQKAADKFTKILSDKDFDATIYTMSNGLTCDTKQKICKKSKWDEKADAHWTAVLFGESAVHSSNGKNTKEIKVALNDCKVHIAEKFDIPMAAISISGGSQLGSTITVPVKLKWDEPYLKESGECKVTNGNVSYRVLD